MKKLLLFTPILAILISCTGGTSESGSGSGTLSINYELDTVMIDGGDHFFFVQYGLSMAVLDRENKQLLNYNPDKFEVEVIDLVGLKLKEVKTYEKEGPNGIGGGFIMKLQKLPNQNLIFYDYMGMHFLDPSGQKSKTLLFDQTKFSGDSLNGEETVDIPSLVTKDGKVFHGFYGVQSFDGATKGLAIVDLEKNSLKLIPSDILDFTSELTIDYEIDGRGAAQYPEQNYVHFEAGKMIISTSAKNQMWIYDPKSEEITSKSFVSELTSNSKKGAFPRKVSSSEGWGNAVKEKRKEVSFKDLVYDPVSERFWRFSTEMDRLTSRDSVVLKTVLTAFDKDLNQVAETRLPENFLASGSIFALDGYLWQFLNVEDEVAFVRLKPNFETL
jgi:hypothetical protein